MRQSASVLPEAFAAECPIDSRSDEPNPSGVAKGNRGACSANAFDK